MRVSYHCDMANFLASVVNPNLYFISYESYDLVNTCDLEER